MTRTPKQARSIQTKEKILDAAYRLLCAKGYYNTSTNEIAKEAGVPIGSVYSYFKDKDTILLEILRRYHDEFENSTSEMTLSLEAYRSDIKVWLRELIGDLIRVHEAGKELNREMKILSYNIPEVAALLNDQMEGSRRTALNFINQMKDEIRYPDIEAAATVVFDTMSATVHRIVFEKNDISNERIIEACIEEIYRFLVE